jgi:ribosome-binding protein aMBF1 (putative translation factor)
MEHQNWTPVILSNPKLKKKNQPTTIVDRRDTKQNTVKTDAEGDVIGVKKVSKEMANELVKARTSKNLTQVQLARMCNLDSKVIGDNERGGCLYDAQIWNKLCKELGVKIERNTN